MDSIIQGRIDFAVVQGTCARHIYHALNSSSLNKEGLLDVGIYAYAPDGHDAPWTDPKDLAQSKFALCLDGATIAWRLPALLRSGQLVMLDDTSAAIGHWYQALQPWVHYVPIASDSYEDIFNTTKFLIANDDLAQSIAENGRRFARELITPLSSECYIKKMLETYASLMRFTPRPLGPNAIPLTKAVELIESDLEWLEQHGSNPPK